MQIVNKWGANYLIASVEERIDSKIRKEKIYFGKTLIYPGIKIKKIGEKNRSSFEMNNGHFLEYQGLIKVQSIEYCVFKPKNADEIKDENEYRYVFAITSFPKPEKLLISNSKGNGFCDIDCSTVELFIIENVQLKLTI